MINSLTFDIDGIDYHLADEQTTFSYFFSSVLEVFEDFIWLYGDTSIFNTSLRSKCEQGVVELMANSMQNFCDASLLPILSNAIPVDRDTSFLIVESGSDLNAIYDLWVNYSEMTHNEFLETIFNMGCKFYFESVHYRSWTIYCYEDCKSVLDVLFLKHKYLNDSINFIKKDIYL